MERIVYVLGAGFSAPLGLPLVRNFLVKSKDMYFANERYQSFKEVLEIIEGMHVAKSYYKTDLFNIEEIFSILQMREQLAGNGSSVPIVEYIKKVIEHSTPVFKAYEGRLPGNWHNFVCGEGIQATYIAFVSSLRGIHFLEGKKNDQRAFFIQQTSTPQAEYSIITLNYDLVIEKSDKFLTDNYEMLSVHIPPLPKPRTSLIPLKIAKLHGSIDSSNIVPPTWNKALNSKIEKDWKLAYALLTSATQIRFLGYSLPSADAYIKYLLKAAALGAKHLKAIDVICLDKDGSVRRRYDELIDFNFYRFCNGSIEKYLSNMYSNYSRPNVAGDNNVTLLFDRLEYCHEWFINTVAGTG